MVEGSQPAIVRNHKDTVFRMLFSEKKALLELYNAVNKTAYREWKELEIKTLKNAVYMNMKNDISFIFQFCFNLYEHQSTFNPNMPLRDLFYIARQLQEYMTQDTMYTKTLVKLPTPKFVVFYNGTEEQPERQILKLSDAFEIPLENPWLELRVLVLNINQGKNQEMMETCQTLKEYCDFVARIRSHAEKMSIERAVEQAVEECIKENILAEFLFWLMYKNL